MMRGSSSTGGFLAAIEVLAAPGGTLMPLKSRLAKPVGKAARTMFLYYFTKNVTQPPNIKNLDENDVIYVIYLFLIQDRGFSLCLHLF